MSRHGGIVAGGLVMVGTALGISRPAASQSILYVDAAAAPGGDGTSWVSAYRFLADAIDDAFVPGHDITEIRVAQGTYRPDRSELHPLGTGDRFAVFFSVKDVRIKGGYAGSGAPDPNQRNVAMYETILTADLNGDDGPDFANNDENSYHVVSVSGNSGPNRLLDGFTITGGNANGEGTGPGHGAGVFVWSGATNVTLKSCTIAGNRTTSQGGGVYAAYADPTLIDCTIQGNEADSLGGGMYCDHASPTLTRCMFIENSALGMPVAYGGGMYITESAPTLTDCSFVGDFAAATGGGIYNTDQSSTTLVNTIFRECTASGVGAIRNIAGSQVTMIGCTLIGNSAGTAGGLTNSSDSSVAATRCRFLGNRSTATGTGAVSTSGTAVLTSCLFSGNQTSADGGAVYCYGSDGITTLTNCSFGGNTAGGEGAGVYVFTVFHDIAVSNCLFWNNTDSGGTTESAQLRAFSWGEVSVNHSSIQNWTGVLGGTGNDGDDPLFVDADGDDNTAGTEDDNLRLAAASQAVDGGDAGVSPPPASRDLDGHARVLCAGIDRGAYEFGIGDVNCDRNVDLADFAAWAACATGPGSGSFSEDCAAFDFELDLDVDLADFAGLQRAFLAGMP